MKKILFFVVIVALLSACNTGNNTGLDKTAIINAYQDSVKKAADTAGLSDFQNWKAENELADVREYNQSQSVAAIPLTQNKIATTRKASGGASNKSRSVSNESGALNSQSSNTALRKKGWSKAAKGAAIGTAGGAVVGAVVNKKNRVAGGVVGGIIGAGVGYGVGRAKDKKEGRN